MRHVIVLAVTASFFGLAACNKSPPEQPAAESPAAAPPATPATAADTAAIDAAIASTERLPGDADEDAWRKPKEVLTFLEARPGMRVVDYFSASGYYTELLSRVVGSNGKVIAYNNAEYLKFSGEKPNQRYGNNRLPNVEQLTTKPEEAPFEPASLDGALFVMSYHDLRWRSKDGTFPAVDATQALAKLALALKPGAVAVVLDHAAAPGASLDTIDATHRIDPAIIKQDFEAAGLKFEAESKAFANAEDDHTKPVFDPAIRHKTDQVLYRFRKP